MTIELDNKELRDAWDWLARTSSGLVIYRHLQKICLEKAPSIDGGALPFFEGRRSLAFDLMANMSEDIGDNDRACVTFRTAKSAAVSGSRGAGRRITADTFIPGYDTEPAGTSNGSGSTGGST
jgi:hypothetical protein